MWIYEAHFYSLCMKVYKQLKQLNNFKFMKHLFNRLCTEVYEQFIQLNYVNLCSECLIFLHSNVHKQFMKHRRKWFMNCMTVNNCMVEKWSEQIYQSDNLRIDMVLNFSNRIFNSIRIVLQMIWKGSCFTCISKMRRVLSYSG